MTLLDKTWQIVCVNAYIEARAHAIYAENQGCLTLRILLTGASFEETTLIK